MFTNKCVRNALVTALVTAIFLAIASRFNAQSILGIAIISTVVYFICSFSSSDKNSAVLDKE